MEKNGNCSYENNNKEENMTSEEQVSHMSESAIQRYGNLYKALAQFQAECPRIGYDAKVKVRLQNGGEYVFEYATLQKIKDVVTPYLTKNGLCITQRFESNSETLLITELLHIEGAKISSKIVLPFKEDMSMQERGAVITYFRRYSYASILGLVADEDEDGNTVEPRVDSFQKKQGGKTKKVEKKESVNEELPEYTIDMVKEKVEVKEGKTGWYIDTDLSGDNPNRRLIKAAGFSYQPDKRIWVKPYPEAVIKP